MSHNHRSSGSIQQKIRENIEQHRLSDDQLSQLSKMQSDYDEDASMKPRYTLAKIPVSIVACLVLAISAGYFAPREIWDQTTVPVATQQELLTSIAEEVIKNHVKLKPLDIKTQSITEAQTFFKHLDFMPIESLLAEKAFALKSDELLGGRYCSIQGTTAAQLRYQDNQASLKTLYQVPYDPALYGEIPHTTDKQAAIELNMNGLNVRLWQERGLMMVLVSP